MEDWGGSFTAAGLNLRKKELLAPYTTFGIGGPADYFAEARDEKEFKTFFAWARQKKIPVFVLGFGSNVLVSDRGFQGLVIRLDGAFRELRCQGLHILAGAAARVPKLVTFAANAGFKGMECLIGVPGTVGGALVMNAGTKDGEISDHLEEVKTFNVSRLTFDVLKKKQIKFKYRWSSLQRNNSIIVSARFGFPMAASRTEVLKKINGYILYRKETQPINTKNVGSVFKNPEGYFAARLIESAGLKGARVGRALISPIHANFIVNLGGAKAQDVLALIRLAQKTVYQKYKVKLEPEVKMIGKF